MKLSQVFTAVLGLAGVFKGSEQQGHVWGTMYTGDVKLHFEPGGTFGFGGRRKDTRALL